MNHDQYTSLPDSPCIGCPAVVNLRHALHLHKMISASNGSNLVIIGQSMGGPDKIPPGPGAGRRLQAALKGRVLQGFFLFIPVIKGPYSLPSASPEVSSNPVSPCRSMASLCIPFIGILRPPSKKDTADLGQQGHQAAFQFFLL